MRFIQLLIMIRTSHRGCKTLRNPSDSRGSSSATRTAVLRGVLRAHLQAADCPPARFLIWCRRLVGGQRLSGGSAAWPRPPGQAPTGLSFAAGPRGAAERRGLRLRRRVPAPRGHRLDTDGGHVSRHPKIRLQERQHRAVFSVRG